MSQKLDQDGTSCLTFFLSTKFREKGKKLSLKNDILPYSFYSLLRENSVSFSAVRTALYTNDLYASFVTDCWLRTLVFTQLMNGSILMKSDEVTGLEGLHSQRQRNLKLFAA